MSNEKQKPVVIEPGETEPAEDRLTEKEEHALRYWQSSTQAPLAPSTNAKLFALFLNGKNTDEILRMNPGFSLGQIVHARVSGEWDKLKHQHLVDLLKETMGRVQQVTLESANFISDLLSATHKLQGDAVKRFLQSGDPRDLGDLQVTSPTGYKMLVELLLKVTGQDKTAGPQISLNIGSTAPVLSADKAPSSTEAAMTLRDIRDKARGIEASKKRN